MAEPIPSLQHWRDRAKEARSAAEFMIDDYSKRVMLEIAERYELIVKRADVKISSTSPHKE